MALFLEKLGSDFDRYINNYKIPPYTNSHASAFVRHISAGSAIGSAKIATVGSLFGGLFGRGATAFGREDSFEKNSIEDKIKDLKVDKSLFYYKIVEYCTAKGLDEVDVYQNAFVSKEVFSKIRSMRNTDYIPSKSTVICLCLSLELSIVQTQEMLDIVGYSLSDHLLADKIIAFCIEHNEHQVDEISTCIYNKTGKWYLMRAI